MRKSIATVSVGGTLEDKLAAISAAKFGGVEIFDGDLVSSHLTPLDVARRCSDLGLEIHLFQPFRDAEGVPGERFPEVVRRFHFKLDVMEQLGTSTVLVCSNVAPDALDDLDLSAGQLATLGELAAERGFTIGFEALAWGTHVNRVGQAWDVVQRVGSPSVGLVVDTFHLLARGDDATALCGIPGDRIALLQIADAPHLSLDVLEWSRHHRCFPGQGTFDVAGVVGTVVEAGYRGPLSLEVFSDVVREASPRATALDAMRSLMFLEEQLRDRWEGPDGSWRISPRPELFDPPPVPAPVSVGVVEIAVDPGSSQLPTLLTGLGFEVAGRHRSKAVTWWRNGGAHIALNAESDLSTHRPAALRRPQVTGVGMLCDRAEEAADRATALLWPAVGRRRGPGEGALPGVLSPAGVEVFFSPPSGPGRWQDDFVPVTTAYEGLEPDREPETGWSGVDHLGIAVAEDGLDAEVSFLRTVLGLRPGPITEFMEPDGRLRSRILRPNVGQLRIALSVTFRPRGERPSIGLNQIAFACTDLLERVRAIRAAGVRLMAVPANYYDDLRARLDPDPELLATLRELEVLYDRTPTGEFLHVYTPVIDGRFYIELVERIGDYEGFGTPNTHVRLVAQSPSRAITTRGDAFGTSRES